MYISHQPIACKSLDFAGQMQSLLDRDFDMETDHHFEVKSCFDTRS